MDEGRRKIAPTKKEPVKSADSVVAVHGKGVRGPAKSAGEDSDGKAVRRSARKKTTKALAVRKPISISQYAKNRQRILDFVASQLKEGIDFGPAYKGSKPTLLKPGAEKFSALLTLEPIFMVDLDAWTMLGSKDGMVCFVCFLMDSGRKLEALEKIGELGADQRMSVYQSMSVAEGRGVGFLGEKKSDKRPEGQQDANTIVKIAEKRALVDAVLRVAGLSEIFTQDGDNGNGKGETGTETKRKKPEAVPENATEQVETVLGKMTWLPDATKEMYRKQAAKFVEKKDLKSLRGLAASLTKQIALKKQEGGTK